MNGTKWVLNETLLFLIYEYKYDEGTFYSEYAKPKKYSNETAEWYGYPALDGAIYYPTFWPSFSVVKTYLVERFENTTGYFYEFMGKTYAHEMKDEAHYAHSILRVLNASYSGDLYLPNKMYNVYQFDYHGAFVNAMKTEENVFRRHTSYGYPLRYGPQPVSATSFVNFMEIVIGVPQAGMWGVQKWIRDPETGALDLDGNLYTRDDQYFVLGEHTSWDNWTHAWENMNTHVMWEPNGSVYDDEMNTYSYLGIDTFTWGFEWNTTFSWYHANDFSRVTASELDQVNETLHTIEGLPRPGYWDVAWLVMNVTWEDVLQEAEVKGYDWITSNERSWAWLSFGVGQHYGTSFTENETANWLGINTRYEFSGLMIWEDLDSNNQMDVDLLDPGSGELTHYLIPTSVENTSIVRPGMRYGNTNETDSMWLNLTEEVTWGIHFYGINGTAFPFTLGGYFGWYEDITTGSDLESFDERPTDVSIDEISFVVHFQGHLNTTGGALNNYAKMKVDNYVGNWEVDMVGGRDNLENKSLALNYFADTNLTSFSMKVNGSFQDNEKTVSSERFEFETAGARFAEMIMGGVSYDWGKNASVQIDVTSYTTPLGTFRTAFESTSGKSATAWSFTTTMFYLTIGFPNWEGFSVYQDPVFIGYISAGGTGSAVPEGLQFSSLSISPTTPLPDESVTIGVDITTVESIQWVRIKYTTDWEDIFWADMVESSPGHWEGEIPAHENGTLVYFEVHVQTESNLYYTETQQYTVGEEVTFTTTTTTTTPPIEGFPIEFIVLGAGIAGVVIILLILVLRRRK
jgi:hypothetical protein